MLTSKKPLVKWPPVEPISLTLVRHGECGGRDLPNGLGPPLTARGRRQAHRVAKRLAAEKFDHIYCSSAARTLQTAEAITSYHPDTPFTVSDDIREVAGYHVLDGHPLHPPPARAELVREQERVRRFVDHILRVHRPGERILVVGHGFLFNVLLGMFAGVTPKRGYRFRILNTSVTVLHVWREMAPLVVMLGSTSHLPLRMTT